MKTPTRSLIILAGLAMSACSKQTDYSEISARALSKTVGVVMSKKMEEGAAWTKVHCQPGAVKKEMPNAPITRGVIELTSWPKESAYSDFDHTLKKLLEFEGGAIKLPNGHVLLPRPSLVASVYPVAERANLPHYVLDRTISPSVNGTSTLNVKLLKEGKVFASMQSPYNEAHGDCSTKIYHKTGWGERQFFFEVFGVAATAELKPPKLERWKAEIVPTKAEVPLRSADELDQVLSNAPGCTEMVKPRRKVAVYDTMRQFRPGDEAAYRRSTSLVSVQSEANGWVDWRPHPLTAPGHAFCIQDRVYSLVITNMTTELVELDAKTGAFTGIRGITAKSLINFPREPGRATLVAEEISASETAPRVRFSAYHIPTTTRDVDSVQVPGITPIGSFELLLTEPGK